MAFYNNKARKTWSIKLKPNLGNVVNWTVPTYQVYLAEAKGKQN